jgi:hypothetical protein
MLPGRKLLLESWFTHLTTSRQLHEFTNCDRGVIGMRPHIPLGFIPVFPDGLTFVACLVGMVASSGAAVKFG